MDTFAQAYIERANDITEVIDQPITVGFHIGNLHVESADLNPVNIPEHIANGINHLIDWIFSKESA
jgi:hypothetical protein